MMQTPFPRSPCVSHQQLRGEWRGEAPALRVLRPLLHQQPGVGTSRPAPRHVSVFALCTRLSGLSFSGLCANKRNLPLGLCLRKDSRHLRQTNRYARWLGSHADWSSSSSSVGW